MVPPFDYQSILIRIIRLPILSQINYLLFWQDTGVLFSVNYSLSRRDDPWSRNQPMSHHFYTLSLIFQYPYDIPLTGPSDYLFYSR